MTTIPPEQFYDALSEQYDAMTDFDARVVRETETLRPLVEKYSMKTAVDMGCGSGVHVLALASLGVQATGVDLSERMLEQARAHAATLPGTAFFPGDFLSSFPPELLAVDAILCLGNSLPHIDSAGRLLAVFSHWKRHLVPGGKIVVQLLNYARIMRQRERIVGIRRDGATAFVRFYDLVFLI